MKKYIIINSDHNDGDITTEINEITDEKLEKYLPLIKAIKENSGEWLSGDQGSLKDQYEEFEFKLKENFNSYVGNGEGYGIHTIESIEILEVINETKLL